MKSLKFIGLQFRGIDDLKLFYRGVLYMVIRLFVGFLFNFRKCVFQLFRKFFFFNVCELIDFCDCY